MKLLGILLAAITVASAAELYNPEWVPALQVGKEYVFKYYSQVLTGVPSISGIFTGIKVTATCRAQVERGQRIAIKLEDISLCKINENTGTFLPRDILPEGICGALPSEQAEVLLQQIQVPIKIKYAGGEVLELEAAVEDPYWSLNIKRAVVNLLKINLDERNAIRDTHANIYEMLLKNKYPSSSSGSESNLYKVMEDGIDGECESIYGVYEKSGKFEQPKPEFFVSKIRNYQNCAQRPVFEAGILSHLDTPLAPAQRKELIKSVSHASYHILGQRNGEHLIREVNLTSEHVFTPYTELDSTVSTASRQTLTLVNVKQISAPIQLPRERKSLVGNCLRMEMPEVAMLQKLPNEMDPHGKARWASSAAQNVQERIEIVEQLLEEIVSATAEAVDMETPKLVMKAVLVLRQLPTEALEKLVTKYAQSAQSPAKLEILLDCLPLLGSPEVAPLLVRLIQNQVVSSPRAALIINMYCLTVKPTPDVIFTLLNFYKSPALATERQVKIALLLGSGTVINKWHRQSIALKTPAAIKVPTQERIAKMIQTAYESAQSTEEKIAVLKCIGNSGLPSFVPLLETVACSKSIPVDTRLQAIYALRRIAPVLKRKVQSLVLPLYLDVTEHHQIRIGAFITIMDSYPSTGIVQTVCHSLTKETSVQVGSFVYTYLKTLIQTQDPVLRPLVEIIRPHFLSIKPIVSGLKNSHGIHMDTFSEYLQMGGNLDLFMITKKDAPFPEILTSSVKLNVFGKPLNVLEGGVEVRRLSELIRRVLGLEGLASEVMNGQVSVTEVLLKLIKSQSSGASRDESSTVDLYSYIKLLGNELRFFDINSDYIMSLLRSDLSAVSDIGRVLREGVSIATLKTLPLFENCLVIPSPCGFPVTVNLTTVLMAKVNGNVKLPGVSSLQDILRITRQEGAIKAQVALKSSVAVEVIASMGVDMSVLKTSQAIVGRLAVQAPVKGEILYDSKTGKIEAQLDVPQEEVSLLKAEVAPLGIVQAMPLRPTKEVFEMEIVAIEDSQAAKKIPFSTTLGASAIGVEMSIEGQSSYNVRSGTPFTLLAGKQECEVILRPGADKPSKVKIQLLLVTPMSQIRSSEILSALSEEKVIHSSSEAPQDSDEDIWWWPFQPKSDSYEASGEEFLQFAPVTPDSIISSPQVYKLILTASTLGDSTPRSIQAQITHMISSGGLAACQTNIQILRTPIRNLETSPWKLVVDNVIQLAPLTEEQTLWKCKVVCGSAQTMREIVTIKAKSLTELPTIVAEELVIPEMCQQREMCPVIATEMIVSKNVPVFITEYRLNYWNSLKKFLYPYTTVKVPTQEAASSQEKSSFITVLMPKLRAAHMILSTPFETDIIHGLPISSMFLQTLAYPELQEGAKVKVPATCDVQSKSVKTIEKVSLSLPKDSDCEMILAEGCEYSSPYAVTIKRAPESPAKKIIKVLIPKHKIEIIPSGHKALRVKVNDELKVLGKRPIIIYEDKKSSKSSVLCEIWQEGHSVRVILQKYGVAIVTDGAHQAVKVSPWAVSQTCGLCRIAETVPIKDKKSQHIQDEQKSQHIARYLVPSRTCHVRS